MRPTRPAMRSGASRVPLGKRDLPGKRDLQRGGGVLGGSGSGAAVLLLRRPRAGSARDVATAHTADDQAETILHRILRGTGIAGLGGIRRARPLDPGVSLIRPLSAIPRVLLQDYLAALEQPCRQDSTNTQLRFTRNRLRHELLPHLAAHYNPRVVAVLTRLGSQAAEVQALLERAVEELRRRAVVDARDAAVTVDCAALAGSPPWLVRELFVGIGGASTGR